MGKNKAGPPGLPPYLFNPAWLCWAITICWHWHTCSRAGVGGGHPLQCAMCVRTPSRYDTRRIPKKRGRPLRPDQKRGSIEQQVPELHFPVAHPVLVIPPLLVWRVKFTLSSLSCSISAILHPAATLLLRSLNRTSVETPGEARARGAMICSLRSFALIHSSPTYPPIAYTARNHKLIAVYRVQVPRHF